ncbi:M48 family metallopeptidase [Ramlibacter sp. PS3R-8]|uniref:M48 family metallopeptidase n=1 Tax=Ramlibacter sp. PS3R-8 TaxID=3133437 RepID=UPI0030A6D363
MATGSLRGAWFDGASSGAREVDITLSRAARGPSLSLAPRDGTPPLQLAHHEVEWPEAWSARRIPAKVVVDLGRHGSLQVDDAAGWHAAAEAAGRKIPLAQRMQTRWSVFLLVAAVAIAGLAAFYRWGTPWAATQLTRQVPLEWELGVSDRGLRDMDAAWLKPSKLPPEREAELRARFDAMTALVTPDLRRYPAYAPKLALHLRSGLGANAFALPGGTIVMTDGMVEAAAKQGLGDDALVGVLAHEIGHVVHRHTTRMVVEQGVLNVGLGIALGDVSTIVSMGGSVLTGLAYRRNHETEADCFAIALMRRAALPTAPMADLLLGIEAGQHGRKPGAESAQGSSWTNLLSSHPDTPQRARGLKDGHTEGCR